jgi:hypothetical protein
VARGPSTLTLRWNSKWRRLRATRVLYSSRDGRCLAITRAPRSCKPIACSQPQVLPVEGVPQPGSRAPTLNEVMSNMWVSRAAILLVKSTSDECCVRSRTGLELLPLVQQELKNSFKVWSISEVCNYPSSLQIALLSVSMRVIGSDHGPVARWPRAPYLTDALGRRKQGPPSFPRRPCP